MIVITEEFIIMEPEGLVSKLWDKSAKVKI